MLKEQIPMLMFHQEKKDYCASLVSVENDANDMFSLALKPNLLINSILSVDNSAFVAPPVDC
jgi:hypothetical protein